MEKRTRERIALAMLLVLGVGVAIAMGWYILIGHNWNIAAVHIDDYVGEMEDYTVVAYDGVLPRPAEVAQIIDADPNAPKQKRGEDDAFVPVSAKEVADSYQGKNADVLVISTDDAGRYSEPEILLCGGKRIGVFSLHGAYQFAEMKKNVVYLRDHSVDMIVAVLEDQLLKDSYVHDVDLVIYACDAAINSNGEYVGSVFYADSPSPGEAKVIILSPNNMMTAKTVTEL